MAQEVTRIKKRIKSVTGSYKITSAMKLVSTVKLKKWKAKMLATKDYALRIDEIAKMVFSSVEESNNPYFTLNLFSIMVLIPLTCPSIRFKRLISFFFCSSERFVVLQQALSINNLTIPPRGIYKIQKGPRKVKLTNGISRKDYLMK